MSFKFIGNSLAKEGGLNLRKFYLRAWDWHDYGKSPLKFCVMKKLLLLFLGLSGTWASAQNILDNKVTFKYTQLPAVKINDATKTYSVEVSMGYQQRNTDSTNAYDLASKNYLTTLSTYMDAYDQQKAQIDRQHLNNMIIWENQVIAGNTTAVAPVKPPYPGMNPPVRPKKPFLIKEIQPTSIIPAIKIDGLTQNTGSAAKIKIVFEGFEKGMIKLEQSGTAPAIKYFYSIQYRHPLSLQVEAAGKGMVYSQRMAETEGFRSWRTKEFKTKSELELWWYDNENIVWEERQTQAIQENISVLNSYFVSTYGYPVQSRRIELYSAKQKNIDYSDVQKAYSTMETALLMLAYPDKIQQAQAKLQEALGMYNQILQESNPNDKKARVDANVTSACLVNMTEAYIWLNDYSNAEMTANKVITIGVNKYERDARAHLEFIRFQQARYAANQ